MSVYLDWYEQKLPHWFFFVNNTSMSFFLDWYHKNKKYLCQFIWTGTKKDIYLMSIYLEALLFFFCKNCHFILTGAMILKKVFYKRNTFMSFYLDWYYVI